MTITSFGIWFCSRRENVPPETTAAASADSQQSSEGHAHDNENEPESDEALAWRMMQEEEQAFQQRMMAMAGIGKRLLRHIFLPFVSQLIVLSET